MQLQAAFFAVAGVLASLGVVSAVPTAEQRSDGSLYACTDWNWGGNCQNFWFDDGACYNFPSDYQDDISSVGPSQGWTCVLFPNYDCNDNQGTFYVSYPGNAQLTTDNDAFSSFGCYRN